MRAMLVKDLGEFQIIEKLAEVVLDEGAASVERLNESGFRLRLHIGDDAAAWDQPAGVSVLTTDTMVEGVHFDLRHIGWRDLGWKSVAVNLSDLAAMGCEPTYSVATLGLRTDLPVEGLLETYRGMVAACRQFGGALVGGDTVRSPVLFVTVAMVGRSASSGGPAGSAQKLLTRSSASPGDKIGVTGSLGCAGGGLRMFAENLNFDPEIEDHLKQAHNRPRPRVSEGARLVHQGVATAMDISDGLVADLEKLCQASGVGAVVHSESIPVDDVLKRAYPDSWLDLALSGGEDYELLFTAPGELTDEIGSKLDVPVSIIGDIVEEPPEATVLDPEGNPIVVEQGGWDHFRSD